MTLYNLRELKAETQAEVAEGLHALAAKEQRYIGVTGNDISRWERGITRPSARYRQLLAEYYGVTVEELGLARQRPTPQRSTGHLTGPGIQLVDLERTEPADPMVQESQQQWLTVRKAINGRQPALARLVAQLYPKDLQVGDSGVLTKPSWMPDRPVDLDAITIRLAPGQTPEPPITGAEDLTNNVLPLSRSDRRFPRYSYAIRDLAKPKLFENRPCWRLMDGEITDEGGHLTFGHMNYFDAIDTAEALAHETAATHVINDGGLAPATWKGMRLRKAIDNPVDPARRACILSINTLTIRRGRHSTAMVLHDRSAANVATSGGIVSVMPAGVFQPSTVRTADRSSDFDLWRNIMREYSEEFLGNTEHGGDDRPADYDCEPFTSLNKARQEGRLKIYAFGLAVGALDLWTALETVAVFDAEAFDEIFVDAVTVNDEGTIVQTGEQIQSSLIPFTEATINDLMAADRLAIETRLNLTKAWQHREQILCA